MIHRLLLVLLLSVLTGCTSGYFRLTHGAHAADRSLNNYATLSKENKARWEQLSTRIKVQQKIIDRYDKQDPAAKKTDPLTFVTDVEYAEAKARLQKAQTERDALGS